jgi:general secretion pathway protein J
MKSFGNENGFTLVEVLVALTVTALLLTAVYQTVSSATVARQKLAVENSRHHAARIIFERIGRELQSLHFVAGDERTGFSGGIGGGDMELLSYTSTASTPLAKEPGLPARISYQLEAMDRATTTYRLTRTETAALAIGDGRAYKLADNLSEIEIRFLGNGNWANRWDSASDQGVPEAIALTLTLGPENDQDVFRTTWKIGDF